MKMVQDIARNPIEVRFILQNISPPKYATTVQYRSANSSNAKHMFQLTVHTDRVFRLRRRDHGLCICCIAANSTLGVSEYALG